MTGTHPHRLKNIAIIGGCLLLMALTFTWWQAFKAASIIPIVTYEECVKAGYRIVSAYPIQCKTPDGRIFVAPEGTRLSGD